MVDNGHISCKCKMPKFIGVLEAEGKVNSPLGCGQVEASLRNLDRRISRGKLLQDERGIAEHEQGRLQGRLQGGLQGGLVERDAEHNNNNNCNGADALEFLRGTLLASTSESGRKIARMQGAAAQGVHGDYAVTKESRGDKSEQAVHAGERNEPPSTEITASDFGGVESCFLDINCYKCDTAVTSVTLEPTSSVKDHVYCDVYCIANQRNLETVTTEAISGSCDALVLYTAEDLVNPVRDSALLSRRSRSSQRAGGDAVAEAQPCRVCLDEKTIAPLPCCRKLVCDECLTLYVTSQVQLGKAHVRCPISECSGMLETAAVVSHLSGEDLLRYRYFLELSQLDAGTKPCPRCRHFTSLGHPGPVRSELKYKVQCGSCQFVWCFKCHAPWHQGIKCRDYRKGDKQLKSWACVIERGQRNAQKCPKCKIHIQRTEGCDHMVCTQCNTNFCYRCGERYRQLRYFGDHTSNLSVFGCKYRYLPDKPHLRRLIRGSVCGAKVLLAPVVLLLVLVVAAVALVLGVLGYPFYYVCKKRKKRPSLGSWRL
ncbi:probable E3 ubiquitin-protein ligase RNF217 isoform X2 [Syngnathus typhle]|uniref:probable E3 ubiquitin-protein ligase RNF217 isoform X2 n=1 Tax=Syngnathus typhle TaxID=161592 RepID=UPI002A699926|nr:probable E3 ubiquitin-protein ligase RNF217 isoform X2 [Syngnathus typhle]